MMIDPKGNAMTLPPALRQAIRLALPLLEAEMKRYAMNASAYATRDADGKPAFPWAKRDSVYYKRLRQALQVLREAVE